MSWFTVGDLEVARIVESNEPFWAPAQMFAEATPEALAPDLGWLVPDAICPHTGGLMVPIQSYVVRTRWHTILIDTCVGNHKTCDWYPRWHRDTRSTWLAGLAALGVHREQVDFVLCTHLHIDHCGGHTLFRDGRWIAAFPNARYLFARADFADAQTRAARRNDPVFAENIAPIMAAGQGVLVEMDHEIDTQVRLEPTPGHTPGHVAVHLSSRGCEAVTTGDLIHSPIQCRHPEWNFVWDRDQPLARATRRRFLETYSGTDVVLLTSHFPLPSVGRIRAAGQAFAFEYLDGARRGAA